MPAQAAASPERLSEVLLDFGRTPGNYPVRLGEPRELHAQLDTVATWALGRVPAELADRTPELRDAAVLFVLRACFAQGNSHYQVLGMTPGAYTAEALRARYRALIRLTHPDMGVQGLPADAAGIVNRAHEVLSDPALRRLYGEEMSDRAPRAPSRRPGVTPAPRIEHRGGWLDRWSTLNARYPRQVRAGISVGAIGLLLFAAVALMMQDSRDSRRLIVSRAPLAAPAATDATPTVLAGAQRQDLVTASPRAVPAASESREASWLDRMLSGARAPAKQPDEVRDSAKRPAETAAADDAVEAPASKSRKQPAAGTTARDAATARAEVLAETDADADKETSKQRAARRAAARANPPEAAAERRDVAAAAPPVAEFDAAARGRDDSVKTSDDGRPARAAGAIAEEGRPPGAAPSPPAPSRGAVWSVDAAGAKHYLIELISTVERPSDARHRTILLADSKVTGSLLRPALKLSDQYAEIHVEQMKWTDTERPGMLKVRGTIILHARNPQTSVSKRVQYRISAEFWGTPSGTVLADLDLKESN